MEESKKLNSLLTWLYAQCAIDNKSKTIQDLEDGTVIAKLLNDM